MIILYRKPDSRRADGIQERLEDLVVAHRVEVVSGAEAELPVDECDLPVLVEGKRTYTGPDVDAMLDALEGRLAVSRQISGDACYVDPDRPGECL